MPEALNALLASKVVLLDGSTGTLLQRHGLPAGEAPERFCLDRPDILRQVQLQYLEAGSDILYTPTFGANRHKLKAYGLDGRTAELNHRLAELTLATAHPRGRLAAGDVGPTGLFFTPFGEAPVEEALEIFGEQVRALAAAGVDLIVIETMLDLQEARLALLAARAACSLPVIVSMTFDEHGRTLTGSDPLTCLNVLQSLGAYAFGVNCSTGPEAMVPVLAAVKPYARIPLLVKPNAGLPVVQEGRTVFPMDAAAFAGFAEPLHAAGANLVGGCCGTTPEHIRLLGERLGGRTGRLPLVSEGSLLLSSARRTVTVTAGPDAPLRLVGERINPTGKPRLQAQLLAGDLEGVRTAALEQQAQGADLLDVNVSVPGADERVLMLKAVGALSVLTELPLVLDSSSPEVLAAALRLYPGRALVNSLSGERSKLERLLPVLAEYGAAFIVLPLDDDGIPEDAARRRAVLNKILEHCAARGVPLDRVVVDGLALTVSTDPRNADLAIETVRYAARELDLPTVLGLSNISFGLPSRPVLNAAFLSMAAANGLALVIANPAEPTVVSARAGADVLTGRDRGAQAFLERFAHATPAAAAGMTTNADPLRELILRGDRDRIAAALEAELAAGAEPMALLTGRLFPAIQEVGEKYQQRILFLPQLVAAAEAMERGVAVLSPRLEHAEAAVKGTVVLATVKGDVHDIGKKIVALLLRNYGYRVEDLGRSVDAETIVARAEALKADVIGLSALMTTTMTEMPAVLALARKRLPGVRVIVGGAVVTAKYAREIGADGYAPDSVGAAGVVDGLLKRTHGS